MGSISVDGNSIVIDQTGALKGEYDLVFESYDGNSSLKSSLATDKIIIKVDENTEIFPRFKSELETPK